MLRLTHIFLHVYVSVIQLIVDSDAAYLVLSRSKSGIAGFYRLGETSVCTYTGHLSGHVWRGPNGFIIIEYKILCHVVASTVKVEVSGIYHNAQTILSIKVLLDAPGHQQNPALIKIDDSKAIYFVHDNINIIKESKY